MLSLLALHLRLLTLCLLTLVHQTASPSPARPFAGPIAGPLRRTRSGPARPGRDAAVPASAEHETSKYEGSELEGIEHADVTARRATHDDAGYTTESIIVTALLAAAAITIITIIVAKLIDKAHSITL